MLVTSNCAQAVAILPSSIFPNVQVLAKRLAGSLKGLVVPSLPHANKEVLLQGALPRILNTFSPWMDFFQSHQTVPKPLYLPFFHIPDVQVLVKLAGSQKGWKLIRPLLTKCYSKGSTRILIYID
jgi:hypothetical protein